MDISNIVSQLKELDSYSTEFSKLKEQIKWAFAQIIDITNGKFFIVDGELIQWVDGALISVKYYGSGSFANNEITEKYRKYRKLSEQIEEVKKEINVMNAGISVMLADYFNTSDDEFLTIVVNDNVYNIESDVCSKNDPCVLVSEPLFVD